MKLQSKIRSLFDNELLDLLASVCDTRRIASLSQKMKLVGDLLYTYDIKWGLLGGATNRIVMYLGGYAIKTALDDQGYRDNLIEYSICEELQPYVTKSYETNGYLLVSECVRLMTDSEFVTRKQDMLNILRTLSDDYLLGDVGYNMKNFTNWGIRDNGDLVILDYAYVHRATETLFTCPVCGEGILTYDHVFDNLMCTNKTVCHARFTYEDIKAIQGDQVDLDMIEERKKSSLVLKEDQSCVEVQESKRRGRLINRDGKSIIIVDNDDLYYDMMEARKMITTKIDNEKALDLMVEIVNADGDANDVAKRTVIQDFNDLEVRTDGAPEYEMDPDYESERIARYVDAENRSYVKGPFNKTNDKDDENDSDDDSVAESSLDDLVSIVTGGKQMLTNDDVLPYEEDEEECVSVELIPSMKTLANRFINVCADYEDEEDRSVSAGIAASVYRSMHTVAEESPKVGVILDGVPVM